MEEKGRPWPEDDVGTPHSSDETPSGNEKPVATSLETISRPLPTMPPPTTPFVKTPPKTSRVGPRTPDESSKTPRALVAERCQTPT